MRDEQYWVSLVHELRALPAETGWLEFKRNNGGPQEIGEYLSALANTAALEGLPLESIAPTGTRCSLPVPNLFALAPTRNA